MKTPIDEPLAHRELLRRLARARRRWRLRVALRGLAIVLGCAAAILIVASFGMERWRYGADAILAFRVFAWVTIAALIARVIVVPLLRRVPDERIALYLEERDPALDAALLSAVDEVEGARRSGDARPRPERSSQLAGQVVARALHRVRTMEAAHDPERRELQRASGLVALAGAAAMLLVLFGPAALRDGLSLLAVPWRAAEAAPVYAIGVEPGNTRLARGADLEIRAALRGFGAEEAELAVRRGVTGHWDRIPMSGVDSSRFAARLFDLDQPTQYFVESNGVRSPVFTIEVADLPAVERIDLEYRYPAYTGLPVERVEDGGDIAAVRGTTVRVRVTPTLPVQGGRLVIDGETPVAMRLDSAGALVGDLRVTRPGFYAVELRSEDGTLVPGSLDYVIDVLDDHAPTVTFRTPGRDLRVTSLEEVFAEVVADDDFGVQRLELVYAVNGGPEQTIVLHRGRGVREIAAGHTFYLEELSLVPGDVVSYFARARDGGPGDAARLAATDIYFMEVRPFEREYRQAEQAGAPGQGGEQDSPSALSQRQREVIAATFKVVRDSASTSATEQREHVSTITLAQGTLRERVERLAQQMRQRGVLGADSALRIIAEELPRAAAAMREAEELLGRRRPGAALSPEQRALQHLQRAEAAYREVQVALGMPGGGGGGGNQNPEELADLFELDVDKLRNQYESVQRGGRSEAQDREVDETMERLRALAARQQQENERALQRAAQRQQSSGGGGGGSQRQLAQETEELARQLERLARERQSPELAETARRLQDAASAMRRGAAASRDAGAAEGAEALDRLQQARRLLDRERGSRLQRDAEQALRNAEELERRQRELAGDVARLQGESGSDADALARRLDGEKQELAEDVEQLEAQLDRLARDARRDQREAARAFQEAAGDIRERRIPDKLRYSRGVMRGGSPEYARSFEEQIGDDLEALREQVEDAVGAIGNRPGERAGEALDRTRELVRGVESLRDRAQRASEGERGQANRPGQQGQLGGGGQGAAIAGGGGLTPEQVRQFSREYRERREAAEGLRRELSRQGVDTESLESLIEQLRALEGARVYADGEELARLQTAVVEGLKAFEFALRRQLADGEDGPLLGSSGEVPPEFRALVEEYYRSLSRGREP